MQANEMRTDMFTLDLIEFLEMIGEQIGLAVANSLMYTKLQKAYEDINVLKDLIPICSGCKKVRDDKGFWENVESYISRYSQLTFTHGLCPECLKKLYGKDSQTETRVQEPPS